MSEEPCNCLGAAELTPAERRAERRASVSFLLAAAGAIGLGVLYSQGGQPQLEGLLLTVVFGSLAYGLVTIANRLVSGGSHVGPRHALGSAEGDIEEVERDMARGRVISRRTALRRSLGAAVVAMGGAALFPLRSLGPNPGKSLLVTPWKRGLRLVTSDGTVVHATDVPPDGLVTVFPEGHAGSADGQAVLIRVKSGRLKPRPGREDWSPDGLIVFSKQCTHAGCPVGLYEPELHQLLCPCHQSTFDVLDGAKPTGGPAAVALPQLPIRIASDGALVATSDFSAPVGPGFWNEK